MKILRSLMNEFRTNCIVGQPMERLKYDLLEIDVRMEKLLRDANFDPKTARHPESSSDWYIGVREDNGLLDTPRVVSNSPASAVPSMVRSYYKEIRNTVNKDLLAVVSDFSFGMRIRFAICFTPMESEDDPGKKVFRKTLHALKKEGYVIGDLYSMKYFLVDCDKNRELLRTYCINTFGAAPVKILTLGNCISALFMDFECSSSKNTVVQDKLLNVSNASLLKRVSSGAVAAMTYYLSSGEDAAPYLALLRNSIYDMELLTGIHGYIWAEIEKEAEGESQNTIRRTVDELGKLASKYGMFLDQFSLSYIGSMDILFHTDRLALMPSGCWVQSTRESMKTVTREIRTFLPGAELTFGGVAFFEDTPYVNQVHIHTDGSDMECLLGGSCRG